MRGGFAVKGFAYRRSNSHCAASTDIVLEQNALRMSFLVTSSPPSQLARQARPLRAPLSALQSHRIGCTTAPRNQRASRPHTERCGNPGGHPRKSRAGLLREPKISS